MVASATPHTKGSYVDLINTAPFDIAALIISSDVAINTSNTNTSMLMDIAFGTGPEVIRVADIPVGHHGVDVPWWLPLHIPQGTLVRGRIQAAVASDVYDPRIWALRADGFGEFNGWSIADTIGANTATSGPTVGDLSDNAYEQVIASTARDYKAFTMHFCITPSTTASTADFAVDLGVGAGGSEQIVGTWGCSTSTAEAVNRIGQIPFIYRPVPAGSRLAIRKNGTANLSALVIGWA
jgi:hypothetical protein